MVSGVRDIVIGVGHLRRQVAFYSANLGLRVLAKGRVPAAICRSLWQVDDELDTVLMGRVDVPESLRLRLVRTSDLAARPDFDVTPPGPLGLVFETSDMSRTYYRLSGDGVEFHASPVTLDPEEGETPATSPEELRRVTYGRCFDGEYLALHQPARSGTVSPYFSITEPLGCQLVVRDLSGTSSFFAHVLEHATLGSERREGGAWRQAMGLREGTATTVEELASASEEGGRSILLAFSPSVGPAGEVQPPARGICALRFDCDALEARLELAQTLGARLVSPPMSLDHPMLGTGRVATLMAPFGVLLELWQGL